MTPDRYADLLKRLRTAEKPLAAGLARAVRDGSDLRADVTARWEAAEVGGRLDDWIDLTARRTAVRFLLRTVYVRVLEDLGVLVLPGAPEGAGRLRGHWGLQAFREVAPGLGLRSYLAFVFRDLARDFPHLFQQRDDELPLPDEDACKASWDLWHEEDPATGAPVYAWSGADGFDSRFLGDLYQDLDAEVRKRFALLQTPDFVESWMLDHTLVPALEVFDPAELHARGDALRVLDPTCGSGHFLLGAWRRLAAWWEAHGLSRWDAAVRALDSVWGCDLNPHAVDIARFRLLLEVMAWTGETALDRLRALHDHLHLAVMDSLIPWELGAHAQRQGDLYVDSGPLSAYATPWERQANANFLNRDFHVVVGNPPYITPKDPKKREDYRRFWPDSCHRSYALAAPFAERFFDLGCEGAFVGQITANSFMKREFGKKLVTTVFPRVDLTGVIDTSGAYIPGHGTPTVILFGRARVPVGEEVWAILGKRGEPKRPQVPAEGLVWTAIRTAGTEPDDSNPFVTVARMSRETFSQHPWSLGGGASADVMQVVDANGSYLLSTVIEVIGRTTHTGIDPVFIVPADFTSRIAMSGRWVWLVCGEDARDFDIQPGVAAFFPYDASGVPSPPVEGSREDAYFWRYRALLAARVDFGRSIADRGMHYTEHSMFFADRFTRPLGITFAFVATHNHFVLDRGGKVFNRSAPVIKLPADATEDDHLDLLGLLNSSTLGFWMKQVFQGKSGSGIGRGIQPEDWMNRSEYDSTKLQQAPLTTADRPARVALARALDAAAAERAACLPAAVLAGDGSPSTLAAILADARDRYRALTEKLVALQEELDWLTYGSYGLIEPVPTVGPDDVEPLAPGHRPFEILAARADDEADDDEKSAWWSRHGHDRVTEIPARYTGAHRARLEARIAAVEGDPRLQLLETFAFKRRWQTPDLAAEARSAAERWLLDRLEDLFADGPLKDPRPHRLEAIVTALGDDPRAGAVAAVAEGTTAFDLGRVVERLLRGASLPDHPWRVYSEDGLRKRAQWQQTWAAQDAEDRGEAVEVPLPPKYARGDFQRPEFFQTRGKLDVPRERFVAYQDLGAPAWGWNGWRDLARATAQVEALEQVRNDPVAPLPTPSHDDPRRCGATLGLWASLDDVRRWGDADAHDELAAYAREACEQEACPCPLVARWQAWAKGDLKVGAAAGRDEDAPATVEEQAAVLDRLRLAGPTGLPLPDLAASMSTSDERAAALVDTLVGRGEVVVRGRGRRARVALPVREG